MKQHRLTSERTTTPADNKPNALDITAIREPHPPYLPTLSNREITQPMPMNTTAVPMVVA